MNVLTRVSFETSIAFFVCYYYYYYYYYYYFISSYRLFLTYIYSNFESTLFGLTLLCLIYIFTVFFSFSFFCVCFLFFLFMVMCLPRVQVLLGSSQGLSLVLYLYFRFFYVCIVNLSASVFYKTCLLKYLLKFYFLYGSARLSSKMKLLLRYYLSFCVTLKQRFYSAK